MNIDIMTVVQWLLLGNHVLVFFGLACGIVGMIYSSASMFKCRLFLGELTHFLIAGISGGLAFGAGITLTAIPLILLFRVVMYNKYIPNNDVIAFFKEIVTSINLSLLLNISKQILIYSVVIGILIGCALSLINSIFLLLPPDPRKKRQQSSGNTLQPSYFKENLILWGILGLGFGMSLLPIFGNPIGLLVGLLIGMFSFLLGLHPKPAPTQPALRNKLLRLGRIAGFWIVCAIAVVISLLHLLYSIISQPVLGSFILVVILLFFGYLFRQLGKLEYRKPTIHISNNQMKRDSLQTLQSIKTGIVCGVLIYGCAYGIPMAFAFGRFFGVEIGIIALALFCLLGLGFGFSCSAIFYYIYRFKLFLSWKMSCSPEKTIRLMFFVGLFLTSVGMITSSLLSLSP